MDYNLMKTLMVRNQGQTKKFLSIFLRKHYKTIYETKSYILAEGDIPIGLVAHLDTVREQNRAQATLLWDREANIMFCPGYPGFDDKAGIYAIITLIKKGLRPHIILTTDEESAATGAIALSRLPQPFKELHFLIEIDRQGADEYTTYDLTYPSFDKYVSSFGFRKVKGLFSDVSIIAPCWKVAAANVSAGYVNEHTLTETLNINWLEDTIQKIETMLTQPTTPFSWKETPHDSRRTV